MDKKLKLQDIRIRTQLKPGDIGHITWLHGTLYKKEYGYGISFEAYVAAGLHEFYSQYDDSKDRVWIAEYNEEMAGFLLLMHRANNMAQLRYFLITPAYRGIGLGNHLLHLYIEFAKAADYSASYLWTTSDLAAASFLYNRYGFKLTEEKRSLAFGPELKEQRYELIH